MNRSRVAALGMLLLCLGGSSADGQIRRAPDLDRRIRPIPPDRPRAAPDPGRVIRPIRPVSDLIGDANGDELYDSEDARYVRQLVELRRRGRRGRSLPHSELADVAEPCGRLDRADLALLIAGLRAQPTGYPIDSQCHRQPLGTEWDGDDLEEPYRPPPNLDQRFAAIAREVPEFGGLYRQDGELRVVLTDTGESVMERALTTAARVFGDALAPSAEIRAVEGTYDFLQLLEWKQSAATLLSSDGVTLVDADELRNRLTVGVPDMGERGNVEAALVELGVPREAIHFREVPVATLGNHELLPQLTNKLEPLRGGAQIASQPGGDPTDCSVAWIGCSVGFLARRGNTIGFVTNEHCSRNAAAADSSFAQASCPDGLIGTEVTAVPFFTNAQNDDCPSGDSCRFSDSTFVALNPGVRGRIGLLAKSEHDWPFNTTTRVSRIGASPLCGDYVIRVGRTAGQTEGPVSETCCDVTADFRTVGNAPSFVNLLCQTVVDAPPSQGDSGGPVYRLDNGFLDVELVGLHWGNLGDESTFSPMANVQAELGGLDVEWSNEKPAVTILEPAQDAEVGAGAFATVNARASFFDFEDGSCDSGECTMRWIDTKQGSVGDGAIANGEAELTYTLSGSGKRLLIAVGEDRDGALGVDWVEFRTGNATPQVFIQWPPDGQGVWANQPYLVQGGSFDSDLFHALDCSALSWNFSAGTTPSSAQGCTATVTFTGTGQRSMTLTGVDDEGAAATAQATVILNTPPADTGPIVTWLAPSGDALLDPETPVTLTVHGNDPDDAGSIQYEWRVRSNRLIAGGTEVVLGSTSAPDNTATSMVWTPGDTVTLGCGGTSVELVVVATDADGQLGSAVLDSQVAGSPC